MTLLVLTDRGRYEWSIGKRFRPDVRVLDGSHATIDVDGEESEFMRAHFFGVPMTDFPEQRWSGEMARFILDNLVLADSYASLPSRLESSDRADDATKAV